MPISTPIEYSISDEYAKAEAARSGGQSVVDHMVTRATKALGVSKFRYYTTTTSGDWAGYAADVSGQSIIVEGVNGYFYNESTCGAFCADVASWVGVGGYNGSNLIQVGVDQTTNQAWYELLPANAVNEFSVSNGDKMYGDVHFDFGTGHWYVLIDDQTSGTYYTSEFSYSPDQTTAEWITELTPGGSGDVPSFSPVNFSTDTWKDSLGNNWAMVSGAATYNYQITLIATCGRITPSAPGSTEEAFTNTPTAC